MISYYLFMALLITTLVLWAILALREEEPIDQGDEEDAAKAGSGPQNAEHSETAVRAGTSEANHEDA